MPRWLQGCAQRFLFLCCWAQRTPRAELHRVGTAEIYPYPVAGTNALYGPVRGVVSKGCGVCQHDFCSCAPILCRFHRSLCSPAPRRGNARSGGPHHTHQPCTDLVTETRRDFYSLLCCRNRGGPTRRLPRAFGRAHLDSPVSRAALLPPCHEMDGRGAPPTAGGARTGHSQPRTAPQRGGRHPPATRPRPADGMAARV